MDKLTDLELAMNAGARAIEQSAKLHGTTYCYNPLGDTQELPYIEAARILRTTEAAPVVHAKWDAEADGYSDGELVYDHWFCSECGWDDGGSLEEEPNFAFCPHCGAKMDEGAEA